MSSGNVLVLQQQSLLSRLPPVEHATTDDGPWQWWTADTIASVTLSPLSSVQANWPLLYVACEQLGILSRDVARGMIGTVAVETAHTFEPVREAYWLDENWRAANLRYYPWYGRGFVQLTWQSNYERYGKMIGVDLLSDPDLAMRPDVAALVMAAYFRDKGVDLACNARDWSEVRRLVQGAYAGLDTLTSVVEALA